MQVRQARLDIYSRGLVLDKLDTQPYARTACQGVPARGLIDVRRTCVRRAVVAADA
jgi:hypothetical protein